MAKAKKPKGALGSKIVAMLRAREAGRAGYAKADELLEEIVQQMGAGKRKPTPVRLKDGTRAELVDNFAKGNKAWKPVGVARYDIKITRANDVTAKI